MPAAPVEGEEEAAHGYSSRPTACSFRCRCSRGLVRRREPARSAQVVLSAAAGSVAEVEIAGVVAAVRLREVAAAGVAHDENTGGQDARADEAVRAVAGGITAAGTVVAEIDVLAGGVAAARLGEAARAGVAQVLGRCGEEAALAEAVRSAAAGSVTEAEGVADGIAAVPHRVGAARLREASSAGVAQVLGAGGVDYRQGASAEGVVSAAAGICAEVEVPADGVCAAQLREVAATGTANVLIGRGEIAAAHLQCAGAGGAAKRKRVASRQLRCAHGCGAAVDNVGVVAGSRRRTPPLQ